MLRAGAVTSVALTQNALAALKTVGTRLNAVTHLFKNEALQHAQRADDELRAGHDRGLLHGLPYGLKDIVAVAGAPTTWGTPAFADQHFSQDATVALKLRAAGAILVAKLATVEFAGGLGYDHPLASATGAAGNPWDTTRWAHGSSSGPGAAVGAGAIPFAIGSDTAGSIIFPSTACGVAGLRPTYGLVGRSGAMTLSWSLDRLGPMCRTADDCGIVLQAIAGSDPHDPASLPGGYRHDRQHKAQGFRFAVLEGGTDGVDDDVRANFERSLTFLAQLGSIERIPFPDAPWGDVLSIVMAAEAYSSFEEFIISGRLPEAVAKKAHAHRLAASSISAPDYLRAQRIRRILAHQFADLAAPFDAIVTPSQFTVALPIDQPFEPGHPRVWGRPVTTAVSVVGAPSLSIINGLNARGLPTGLHFSAAPLREPALIDAAMAAEAALDLRHLRPQPLAAG
jgi:aspartyl-tRNA(Asn)/glutamyl-tRNA(Gln) amidotransferase subunit A